MLLWRRLLLLATTVAPLPQELELRDVEGSCWLEVEGPAPLGDTQSQAKVQQPPGLLLWMVVTPLCPGYKLLRQSCEPVLL